MGSNKYLHSMNTYVPLHIHFGHRNNVTIIVKLLYRGTSHRQAALLRVDNDYDVIFMFEM